MRGEAIIRPSSKADNHLTITWKFFDDVYIHLDVEEQDKPNPVSLGRSFILEGQRFDDLDEIYSRYPPTPLPSTFF